MRNLRQFCNTIDHSTAQIYCYVHSKVDCCNSIAQPSSQTTWSSSIDSQFCGSSCLENLSFQPHLTLSQILADKWSTHPVQSQWRIPWRGEVARPLRDPKKEKRKKGRRKRKKGKEKEKRRECGEMLFYTLRRLKSWMMSRMSEERMTGAWPFWMSIVIYLWA